jgi:hypothetical protein
LNQLSHTDSSYFVAVIVGKRITRSFIYFYYNIIFIINKDIFSIIATYADKKSRPQMPVRTLEAACHIATGGILKGPA